MGKSCNFLTYKWIHSQLHADKIYKNTQKTASLRTKLSVLFFLLQCEMKVDVVFIKGIEHSGFTFEIMHRQKLRFDLSLNLIIVWIIYMREYACQLKHTPCSIQCSVSFHNTHKDGNCLKFKLHSEFLFFCFFLLALLHILPFQILYVYSTFNLLLRKSIKREKTK